MKNQRTFWQEVREKHYAQGMSRPTEELVAEYNELQDSEIFFQSVTARLTALLDLFRFRGYDIDPLRKGKTITLCKVEVRGNQIVPRGSSEE